MWVSPSFSSLGPSPTRPLFRHSTETALAEATRDLPVAKPTGPSQSLSYVSSANTVLGDDDFSPWLPRAPASARHCSVELSLSSPSCHHEPALRPLPRVSVASSSLTAGSLHKQLPHRNLQPPQHPPAPLPTPRGTPRSSTPTSARTGSSCGLCIPVNGSSYLDKSSGVILDSSFSCSLHSIL